VYFLDLFLLAPKALDEVLFIAGFCVSLNNAVCASLFAAAMAKSAQIGLHT
jgi:NADH:ubiquinone oxidoreductase subunit 5 (subunit L)/multisubunit Na+/H+ antiporter MnhA subunit